jgi:hypothetical protein
MKKNHEKTTGLATLIAGGAKFLACALKILV